MDLIVAWLWEMGLKKESNPDAASSFLSDPEPIGVSGKDDWVERNKAV